MKTLIKYFTIIMSSIVLALHSIGVFANGITPAEIPDAELINEGRELFFEETFDGNGRTCGTCHPANNNLTIDPEFIATLPDDDPLFVAEFVPALSENFENPELMRKLGLILENTNGFSDLENNFTMRSVPHLLALSTSVTPPEADDGTTNSHTDRTGWGGDGSPVGMVTDGDNTLVNNGSVRSFPVGAIIQHFPKTLNREPGVDFRLPTEHELDALEAFLFSLGRQEEFDDFSTITLYDAIAEQGRKNYMGDGLPAGSLNCNACHFNGGANTNPDFDFSISGITPPAFESTNRSFAIRVEEILDQPGDVLAASALDGATQLPFDDGFGTKTDLFNTTTVIEAADTAPFFHSNQSATVEKMIAFYTSNRNFRDPIMNPPAAVLVPLNSSQLSNVAAFIRVLNADENSRQAIELIEYAEMLSREKDKETNVKLAISEIEDALMVLNESRLHSTDAVPLYKGALKKLNRRKSSSFSGIDLTSVKAILEDTRTVLINRRDDLYAEEQEEN